MKPAKLTRREQEITELLAWGASKSYVAKVLFISVRTVENHARNIFEKTGVTKINELSAWWFCTRFHISDLSPIKKQIVATALIIILAPSVLHIDNSIVRTQRARTTRVARARTRRSESEPNLFEL